MLKNLGPLELVSVTLFCATVALWAFVLAPMFHR